MRVKDVLVAVASYWVPLAAVSWGLIAFQPLSLLPVSEEAGVIVALMLLTGISGATFFLRRRNLSTLGYRELLFPVVYIVVWTVVVLGTGTVTGSM